MSTQLFLGIIDGGEWRVAQHIRSRRDDEPFYQASIILSRLKNYSDICNNLHHCKFVTTYDDWTPEMGDEHYSLSSTIGADVLDEIIDCGKYDVVHLSDAREFLKQESFCRYAFIINFDTGKLTAYHSGDRFIFGEYDLDNLPSIYRFMDDLEEFEKEHLYEINRIIHSSAIMMLRDNAIAQGLDPDEAERKFLEAISVTTDDEEDEEE